MNAAPGAEPAQLQRHRTRRALLRAGVAVAVAGVAAAAASALRFDGRPAQPAAGHSAPPATADVTLETLVDVRDIEGELGYGLATPVTGRAAGTVTWLAPAGSVVDRGGVLLRIDDRPVVLLYGPLPVYRVLAKGTKGADVRQLKENLRHLGHAELTVDHTFNAATETAVKRWQRSLGLDATGVVDADRIVYGPDRVRIAAHKTRPGNAATGELLTFTATSKVVAVELKLADQRLAIKGGKVALALPGDPDIAGTVTEIGTEAEPTDGGEPVVTVIVTPDDQAAFGGLSAAPVIVRFIAAERKDVLAVPIAALLALPAGGYGVQVIEAGSGRLVMVETGMFARGRVEVRADGLAAGMKVGVPG